MSNGIRLKVEPIEFPEASSGKKYLCCGWFVAPSSLPSGVPSSLFSWMANDGIIEGYRSNDHFPVNILPLSIVLPTPGLSLFMAVAFPPGDLIDLAFIDLP